MLGEPEDCVWYRDGDKAVVELNRLAAENAKLHRALGHTEAALCKWGDDSVGEVKIKAQELLAENEKLETALRRIQTWSRAYPLDIFEKPDLKKAARVLKAAGMTLDAITGDSMRHVLSGIKDIVDAALKEPTDEASNG